jgi:hypothetical protein
MSTRTQHLIVQFKKDGHPLGRTIHSEEVPRLIVALRQRLACTSGELDLSAESLKLLEQRMIALKEALRIGSLMMDDEETMRLMREVTAYLGQVIVVNLGGEWDPSPHLWSTSVSVPIPVETTKGDEIRVSSSRGIAVAPTVAYFWDMIGTGKEKEFLWKEYTAMIQPRWQEQL